MTMGRELLARLNNLASGAGIELPPRQLVYMSAAPADCEQVTVLFAGWSAQPQLAGLVSCLNTRWCGQFGVMISRQTPAMPVRAGLTAPSVESMMAAAQMSSDDAELLLALVATFDEVGADLLVTTAEPEGGYQAVLLTVTLPAFGGLD